MLEKNQHFQKKKLNQILMKPTDQNKNNWIKGDSDVGDIVMFVTIDYFMESR